MASRPFSYLTEAEWDRITSVSAKGALPHGQAAGRPIVKTEIPGQDSDMSSISPDSAYVTGAALHVDDGCLLR